MRACPRTCTCDQLFRQLAARQGGGGLILGLALPTVIYILADECLYLADQSFSSDPTGMGMGVLEEEGVWEAGGGPRAGTSTSLSAREMGGFRYL